MVRPGTDAGDQKAVFQAARSLEPVTNSLLQSHVLGHVLEKAGAGAAGGCGVVRRDDNKFS